MPSPAAPVVVSPVASLADRRAFVDLPFRLHAGTPWVPPLKLERHLFLDRRTNAWFKHAEAQLFLARRAGRVVGRVSAQVDRAYWDHHGEPWGNFGFLEAEDDPEVFAALLGAADGWLRGAGADRMVGPFDFTMNDEAGVLVEGFEREPMIKQPWHPPYYARRLEEAGLGKAIDLLMYELVVNDREKVLPIIFELAEKCRTDHGITIRKMSRRRLREDLDLFGETYNEAWKRNWGFVPYGKTDLDQYAAELQLVFDPNWFMVAEDPTGKAVGIAITVPDVNQALARMGGRLLPTGWWTFLNRAKVIDRVRVGFLGVRPEFQHTGVAALLFVEHFDMASTTPQTWGEQGWILETNTAMNRGMEAMGGRVVKRYRVFERRLAA
jgi:GNAT superfamily N-acetyltransferase